MHFDVILYYKSWFHLSENYCVIYFWLMFLSSFVYSLCVCIHFATQISRKLSLNWNLALISYKTASHPDVHVVSQCVECRYNREIPKIRLICRQVIDARHTMTKQHHNAGYEAGYINRALKCISKTKISYLSLTFNTRGSLAILILLCFTVQNKGIRQYNLCSFCICYTVLNYSINM